MSISCNPQRIISKSHETQPYWISGVEGSYMVGYGSAYKMQDAKSRAMQNIKAQIINAIGQKITVRQTLSRNEIILGETRVYRENYDAEVSSKSIYNKYIKGISILRTEDFYWENQRLNRKQSRIDYYIKYPISEAEIHNYIKQWESLLQTFEEKINLVDRKVFAKQYQSAMDMTRDLDYLILVYKDYPEIRSAEVLNLVGHLKSYLRSVRLTVESNRPGKLIMESRWQNGPLEISDHPIVAPSSGILVNNIKHTGPKIEILYDYSRCNLFKEQFMDIKYHTLCKTQRTYVNLNVLEKEILIRLDKPVMISTTKKRYFENTRKLKCTLSLRSFTPNPLEIDKVILYLNMGYKDFWGTRKSHSAGPFTFSKINVRKNTEGSFLVNLFFNTALLSKYNVSSKSKTSATVSGKILYSSDALDIEREHEFYDIPYLTDW